MFPDLPSSHSRDLRAYATLICMTAKFTYWKESDGMYLGFLNDYPDHWTQGENLADLKVMLLDLFEAFSSEDFPVIRKVAELEVA